MMNEKHEMSYLTKERFKKIAAMLEYDHCGDADILACAYAACNIERESMAEAFRFARALKEAGKMEWCADVAMLCYRFGMEPDMAIERLEQMKAEGISSINDIVQLGVDVAAVYFSEMAWGYDLSLYLCKTAVDLMNEKGIPLDQFGVVINNAIWFKGNLLFAIEHHQEAQGIRAYVSMSGKYPNEALRKEVESALDFPELRYYYEQMLSGYEDAQ